MGQHRQNNQDPKVVPNLCMVIFTSSIRNWGTKECTSLTKPKLTTMWGAGLSFHRVRILWMPLLLKFSCIEVRRKLTKSVFSQKCHAELNVPVDPFTDQVFDGEEGSRAIRFFTHGYDIYTPDKVLVTHDYKTHQSNPVVHSWGGGSRRTTNITEEDWIWMREISQERPKVKTVGTPRVNMLLGIGKFSNNQLAEIKSIRSSRYGLGTKRTLQQAEQFTGLNLQEKKMLENKCGNIKWVPYDPSPDYGLGEVLSRPLVPPLQSEEGGSPLFSSSSSSLLKRKMQAATSANVTTSGIVVVGGTMLMAVLGFTYRKRICAKKKKDRHVN